MSKIIAIDSYRGVIGKSNTSANVAVMLAAQGLRVGAVDTGIQSPGIYCIGVPTDEEMTYTVNDYLTGKCDIEETAIDVIDGTSCRLGVNITSLPV